ncbi:hypothetical protein AH6C_036 [Aeromonas phage pAh6-C]|uniref:Uncharacterized protein n=1 Tax=Aeromonas phage pAh6-C TaxID=1505227 RepID=A0A076G4E4_9CAUD|nr:hypothetical protein AH6C_036 [Aeromonas phage pAh6-C]AII26790.1 hypothetical protein AH6C_036 [Aeromonas phage pAh6-C]
MAKFIAPEMGRFLSYYGLSKYQLNSILRTNGYVRDMRFHPDEDNSFVLERAGNPKTFARLFWTSVIGWALHVKLEDDPLWIVRSE